MFWRFKNKHQHGHGEINEDWQLNNFFKNLVSAKGSHVELKISKITNMTKMNVNVILCLVFLLTIIENLR